MAYILNHVLIDETELYLNIDKNGSFWYGDGFFESMKYVNGKLLFAQLHWERLLASCTLLNMKNPFHDFEHFNQIVHLLGNKQIDSVQRFKLILWRHTFNAYLPEGDDTEYALQSFFYNDVDYPLNINGLRLSIYSENLKSISSIGNIKSTSSQLYVLATLYAQSNKMDDVVLLNTSTNIVETSRSNIYLLIDGTIYTPPLNEGCLDGIMRRVLLQICNDQNIPIQQQPIPPDLLKKANEVFTTSAIRGIQWVASVGEQNFTSKLMSQKLNLLLNSIP